MRIRSRAVPVGIALALTLALAGCGGGEVEEAGPQGEAFDGLTPDQIRAEAEAMSPQEAESLGIVDSMIHLESLTSPEDSAILQDTTRQ